ncbi:MAG: hypothetical protein AAF085_06450 [Planctomycetota bacterium]
MTKKATTLLAVMGLTCFAHISSVQADEPPSQSTNPNAARVAEYAFFMRPPRAGKSYDTWADAAGPDVGEVEVDPARLPSRVDNSARPEFPPVYRQRYGACGQYTAAASMFTYEMNVLNGTKADADERRFPATFSWNMMNRAENNGSEAYHGWEVAKRLGIPTVKTYGSVEEKKIGAWPNGYGVWRDAMNYRVNGYRYTPAQTVEQLNEARGWLYDRNQPAADGAEVAGGLFAMDGRMGKREVISKVTKTIPEGEYAEGQDVWIGWSESGHGHGMTCAGYDDNVGFDVNGDGQITNDKDINGDGEVTLADWERGAYLVVNSWGKKWSGDGKIYLLYSAMIDPTWKRGRYLGRVEVSRSAPRMTLRLKLSCNDRTDLLTTVGLAGNPKADEPEHTFAPEILNGWPVFGRSGPGHVPLAGPGDDTPLELGVDLTALVDQLGPDQDGDSRLFLSFSSKDGSKAVGEVLEAAVRRYDADGVFIYERPIKIDNGAFGEDELTISTVVTGAGTP